MEYHASQRPEKYSGQARYQTDRRTDGRPPPYQPALPQQALYHIEPPQQAPYPQGPPHQDRYPPGPPHQDRYPPGPYQQAPGQPPYQTHQFHPQYYQPPPQQQHQQQQSVVVVNAGHAPAPAPIIVQQEPKPTWLIVLKYVGICFLILFFGPIVLFVWCICLAESES